MIPRTSRQLVLVGKSVAQAEALQIAPRPSLGARIGS